MIAAEGLDRAGRQPGNMVCDAPQSSPVMNCRLHAAPRNKGLIKLDAICSPSYNRCLLVIPRCRAYGGGRSCRNASGERP